MQGSLVLRQSFLERFKSWSIDNTNQCAFTPTSLNGQRTNNYSVKMNTQGWGMRSDGVSDIGIDRFGHFAGLIIRVRLGRRPLSG
jgi:hypothetical protein